MPPAKPVRALALGAALLVGVPTSAGAQAAMQSWLDPTLGKLTLGGNYQLTHYPDQPVEGQGTDFRLIEHDFALSVPLFQDSRNEWSLSSEVSFQDITTRAILPDTGQRFPNELWGVQVGASYRHLFDNGWIGAANVTVGSASDKPFNSVHEMIVRAIAMLRVPQGQRNAWLFSLIYASDEDFLGGAPISGIAYYYAPSERFKAVIGVPFSSIEFRPLDKLTLEAQYFPVRRVRARVTYELFRPLRLYVGFDWDNDHYLLAGRRNNSDQLFYYEKRLSAGVRFDLRHVGFRLAGGYAFDRFYFEGEDYSDRDENRINIKAGPVVSFRMSVRF